MNCHVCHTQLMPEARFCHLCGTPTRQEQTGCPECGARRLPNAQVCHRCGYKYEAGKTLIQGEFKLHVGNSQELEEEIKSHFFNFFEDRLREEQDPRKYKAYLEVFFTSDFSQRFEARVRQLVQEITALADRPSLIAAQKADQLLYRAFRSLCDFFFVHYTAHLNIHPLPEALLEYEGVRKEEVDLLMMILDFLDFEQEEESVYTDFLSMPMEKLKNAAQHFLFPAKEEKILLICDQSVTGSCREGFGFTEKALYWKVHFQKPHTVFYDQIRSLDKHKKWLGINGHFFHAGATLDVKMLKLLRKIQEMSA